MGQSHHLFQSSHGRRFYTNRSSVIIAEYADNSPFRHTTAASSAELPGCLNYRKQLDEAIEKVQEAADALNEIMDAPDKAIPRELLDGAEAVAVFPNTLKAAFIVPGVRV